MTSEAATQPALLHSLELLNIWPGDRIRVVSNNVSDDEEDYSGSTGVVSSVDPTEALPVFVIVDQAEEGFGAVQFSAEELEVATPGPISTYIATQAAALAAAEAERDALREVAQLLHTYSRRYCDQRKTYAPSDHNRATHTLLRLGVQFEKDPISESGPFARDGMYGLTAEDHAVLTQGES